MESTGLTIGGWVFLIGAWGVIGAFTAYCFRKVLRLQPPKRPSAE